MRAFAIVVATVALALAAVPSTLAAPRKNQPQVVFRSARGTPIQPTRTIIHNRDGTTTIITVSRRSYLDPGTEVPVGYPGRMDYAFPPGGDRAGPIGSMGPTNMASAASYLHRGSTYQESTRRTVHRGLNLRAPMFRSCPGVKLGMDTKLWMTMMVLCRARIQVSLGC